MPELNFSGNGYPVYLIFKTIRERSRAPFLIDFNLDKKIKIVSVYEIKKQLALNKPFLVGGTVCIKLIHGCDHEILERLKNLNAITLKGKNSSKVWKKTFKIRNVFKKDGFCCFESEYQSGINFYNLLNIKENPKDKEIIDKPFKKGEVLSFFLDLTHVNLPD